MMLLQGCLIQVCLVPAVFCKDALIASLTFLHSCTLGLEGCRNVFVHHMSMVSLSADGCTAAVSEEGALYTWGDGAAGNLGYCDVLRQFIPRRVEGALLDHNITQV